MTVRHIKSARQKRKFRIKAKVRGTSKRPRLVVFRSNRQIYAQIIDDEKGCTLISFNSMKITQDDKKNKGKKRVDIAFSVGRTLSDLAKKKKIKSVVFDRSGYKYHGQVKALVEGARKNGLII